MAALMDSPFMGRLRITAKPAGGFRRAGVRHPAAPVEHPPGTFTVAQVRQLRAEPDLTVEPLESEETDTGHTDTGQQDTGVIAEGPRPNDPPRPAAEHGTDVGAAAANAAAPPAPRGDGGAAAPHTTPPKAPKAPKAKTAVGDA